MNTGVGILNADRPKRIVGVPRRILPSSDRPAGRTASGGPSARIPVWEITARGLQDRCRAQSTARRQESQYSAEDHKLGDINFIAGGRFKLHAVRNHQPDYGKQQNSGHRDGAVEMLEALGT